MNNGDLTKRERAAIEITKGILANPNLITHGEMVEISSGIKGGKYIIGAAIVLADALLAALNQTG